MNTNLIALSDTAKTGMQRLKGASQSDVFLQSIFDENRSFSSPGIVMVVTPEIAECLLTKNTSNRNTRKLHVAWLAKQMSSGHWDYTGDPIRFSSDGVLLDGQHRLLAVIASGTAQRFLIIGGLESSIFTHIDTGLARTAGDVFSLHGVKNAARAAAIVRRVMNYKNGYVTITSLNARLSSKKVDADLVSNETILQNFLNDPLFKESVDVAGQLYQLSSLLLVSEYGALYYLFAEIDKQDAWEFLAKLASGVDLKSNSPIYVLRKKLEEVKFNNAIQLPKKVHTQYVFYCWGKFRGREPMKILKVPKDYVPTL